MREFHDRFQDEAAPFMDAAAIAAAAAEEGIGGKEREDKEDIRKDNKSQHPSVHGWRQREGHRHRYRSFLLFRRNAMQMDGRGQEILGTGSERLNDRNILCCQ